MEDGHYIQNSSKQGNRKEVKWMDKRNTDDNMMNIRRRIVNISLAFFIPALLNLSVCAQKEAPAEQRGFLWKIWSKDNTVHILGSIHLAKREIYPLSKKIEDAFDSSDVLVVEASIDQIDQFKMQELVMENAFYPEGQTLEGKLSKPTYELAKRKLNEYGIDIHLFNTRKPWFLAFLIEGAEYAKMGFDPKYGIDMYFLGKARGKKRILELEGAEYQIRLLSGFPDDLQELFLFYTLVDIDMLRPRANEMIHAWALGNTRAMESILSKGLGEHPELSPVYQKLIYGRNRNMASKIEAYLGTNDSYFVVVGAAHLLGKGSVIELLKERGFKVEQL